ncbi:hypothetical protein JVT61DRAFT_4497 [Boletus reticuloceps]|uniref:Ubiquitin-like protease family profile domain-containing protein n=1 Tax=Boletus reticuloceps TaxID=495285 RepID=A0A8I2YLQ7_9AGAM|nr:hypothetical protein JVT61DRAFT_4497 [Boletus reticuloceps]
MASRPGTRAALPSTTTGLGQHFTSPRRACDPKKSQQYVTIPGCHNKRQRLLNRLEELLNHKNDLISHPDPGSSAGHLEDSKFPDDDPPRAFDDADDDTMFHTEDDDNVGDVQTIPAAQSYAPRQSEKWKALIPTLIDPYLQYITRTMGKPTPMPTLTLSCCKRGCVPKSVGLVCLYYDHFSTVTVHSCQCASLPQVLMHAGLFPTAPSQPRLAVSIELLFFYRALFERSCDAINALASTLNTHYLRRGFRMCGREVCSVLRSQRSLSTSQLETNLQGQTIQEPFRRSLGHAVQWFNILQVEVERQIESILAAARGRFSEAQKLLPSSTVPPRPDDPPHDPVKSPTSIPDVHPPAPLSCSTILVQRCPACFGGSTYGRSLSAGADIHVATDGNFHHRHRRSAGAGSIFYDPVYFIPKAQVDAMGQHISKARRRPARQRQTQVPDTAVDQCESSYEAADGKKQKAAMESFDDTGVMALICRHDIPLFFANIDSPGEQQKYCISLIEHLFSFLPSVATVTVFYDIGCVTERSLNQYNILDQQITSRLHFATTAMHAYGHEWACQLVYNPRLVDGLGLSDGEGTERLWSRLIKLIGIERASSVSPQIPSLHKLTDGVQRQRRIWLIDHQASAIGHEMRQELGPWLKRRMKKGIGEQGAAAQHALDNCGISISELKSQWNAQRAAQLSIRARTSVPFSSDRNVSYPTDAPARLKKELDTVLVLQADLDASERMLQTARTAIEKDPTAKDALEVLDSMERSHLRLLDKIEVLYASLNVQDQFPHLEGVPLQFVRTLLMARDLKINIRKRAIGSFFEWDKLDRAVGGKDKTLGTKLHQQTRRAIAKRQPALMAALKKFNKYCQALEEIYDPSYSIPLPTPLPTKLADLRSDQSLLQDVWTSPATGEIPRWLEDVEVREGIRALLKRDRCREEQLRLGFEADNMCRWFSQELFSVEVALRDSDTSPFRVLLLHRREDILALQEHWPTTLVSEIQYKTRAEEAVRLATILHREVPSTAELQWLPPLTFPVPSTAVVEEEAVDIAEQNLFGEPPQPEQAILDDVLESGDYEDEEDTPGTTLAVKLQWHTPDVSDILPPPARWATDATQNVIKDDWRVPTQPTVEASLAERIRPATDGLPQLVFEVKAIEILQHPRARLNDTCINGCAVLLHSHFVSTRSSEIAIFSTHDLPRIRYHADDNALWRNTARTRYWEKTLWILPIHRPSSCGHWVVSIIDVSTRQILLFDSFAEQRGWKQDLQDIATFITRLSRLAAVKQGAARRDVGDWIAAPTSLSAVQTNNIDCGLWVLAQIVAVLRGCELMSLGDSDMQTFRQFLLSLVLRLPVAP